MKTADKVQVSWFALISAIIAVFVLVLATFAWYQQNKFTDTGKATARSGDENITLEISSRGGSNFSPKETAPIVQVNGADKMKLMPVSTADLNTFVTNNHTDGGMAKSFSVVRNEDDIYHGRIYIRAKASGDNAQSHMALYLDQTGDSGGRLIKASEQEFINAARMGLRVSGSDKTSSTIFYLSSKANDGDGRVYNTEINGTQLGDGKVLDGSSGTVRAVADPSVSLGSRSIAESSGGYSLPDESIMTLKMNTIYQVDIYLYLEGCDPDCSDAVKFDTSNLHLAFFGVVKN